MSELPILQSFDTEEFLATYWQKKPCLIRQALNGFETVLSPDELAGLACEEGVDSRVITGDAEKNDWALKDGPFNELFFENFPKKSSTLLVQRVDSLVPEIADMRSLFSFIPAWRFDDVMVSFAEDQGSVGPHIDNYDVFLLQGMGKRHWQVEESPVLAEEDLLENCPVRVLKVFRPKYEWTLETGDILYLPPRWAHHGVSVGRGMTYSFGFRSPSVSEMLLGAAEHSLVKHTEKDRYIDPDLNATEQSPRIGQALIDRVKKQLIQAIQEENESHFWLGRVMTSNPNAPTDEELHDYMEVTLEEAQLFLEDNKGVLERAEEVKCAYYCAEDQVHAYIHGHGFQLKMEDTPFIDTLFTHAKISIEALFPFLEESSERKEILINWMRRGYFRIIEEDI
ncbi:MAG: cupin domain-containing protein [Oligoflexales bacterium]